MTLLPGILLALALLWGAPGAEPGAPQALQSRPGALTSLWRDAPGDPARVRIDLIPDLTEPSDLLLHEGGLYTISDSRRSVYRIGFEGPGGAATRSGAWPVSGIPPDVDLEALAALPTGEALLASETNGSIFVLSPFPGHACAAWRTSIEGTCFFGRPNCGIEAMAVLPAGRLFVAKEREPRAAYLFDLPPNPCEAATLGGRTHLKLPDEVGPDISAATYDAASGHLLLVARSAQKVLEFEPPAPTPGDTSPRPMALVGSFSFAATEDSLGYSGLMAHQVEGIAVDEKRVLYLVVDNNERGSARLGGKRPPLLRFFPAE